MSGRVITVLGPVDPAAMGFVDAHSHLWISRVPSLADSAPVLDDEEEILKELHDFRAAGGGAQVDCQPPGCGRDGNKLRLLSEKTGVRVATCTGFHRRQYYPHEAPLFEMSAEKANDFFMDEIKSGLIETQDQGEAPVYPGFIKIAAEASMEASPMALFEAATAASLQSGMGIQMHTEKGAQVERFIDFFVENKLPLERLVICHMDKRTDRALHQDLARAGATLEYDTFFRPKYDPESNLWPLIHYMLADGFENKVVLGTDLAEAHLWRHMGGGPGLAAFITVIQARLHESGVNDETIQKIMGANIAQKLAVQFKEKVS
jgi:5-phospho-D-xylono-1,4-lactonase